MQSPILWVLGLGLPGGGGICLTTLQGRERQCCAVELLVLRMKVMRLLRRGLGPSKDQPSFPPCAEVALQGPRLQNQGSVALRRASCPRAASTDDVRGRACGQAGPSEGWGAGAGVTRPAGPWLTGTPVFSSSRLEQAVTGFHWYFLLVSP